MTDQLSDVADSIFDHGGPGSGKKGHSERERERERERETASQAIIQKRKG